MLTMKREVHGGRRFSPLGIVSSIWSILALVVRSLLISSGNMLAVVALSFQNLQIWRRFIWCSVLIYSLSLGVPGAIASVFMDPDPTTAAAPNLDLVARWASLDGTRDDVHTARGSLFQLLGFHGAEHPRFIGIMAPAEFGAVDHHTSSHTRGTCAATCRTKLCPTQPSWSLC